MLVIDSGSSPEWQFSDNLLKGEFVGTGVISILCSIWLRLLNNEYSRSVSF